MISVLLYISTVVAISVMSLLIGRRLRKSRRWLRSALLGVAVLGTLPYVLAAVRTALLDSQIIARINIGYSAPGVRVVKIVALPNPIQPLAVYVETESSDHTRDGSVAIFDGEKMIGHRQVWTDNGSLSGNVFPPQWHGDP